MVSESRLLVGCIGDICLSLFMWDSACVSVCVLCTLSGTICTYSSSKITVYFMVLKVKFWYFIQGFHWRLRSCMLLCSWLDMWICLLISYRYIILWWSWCLLEALLLLCGACGSTALWSAHMTVSSTHFVITTWLGPVSSGHFCFMRNSLFRRSVCCVYLHGPELQNTFLLNSVLLNVWNSWVYP